MNNLDILKYLIGGYGTSAGYKANKGLKKYLDFMANEKKNKKTYKESLEKWRKIKKTKVEKPKVVKPKVEKPKLVKPKVEKPKVKKPKLVKPKVEKPKVEIKIEKSKEEEKIYTELKNELNKKDYFRDKIIFLNMEYTKTYKIKNDKKRETKRKIIKLLENEEAKIQLEIDKQIINDGLNKYKNDVDKIEYLKSRYNYYINHPNLDNENNTIMSKKQIIRDILKLYSIK